MNKLANKITLGIAALAVAGGTIVLPVVNAAPAQAHNRVCKTVKVAPTAPWYLCTAPYPHSPSNCYWSTKVVCEG